MFNVNNKTKKIAVCIVALSVVALACKVIKTPSCSTCESKN